MNDALLESIAIRCLAPINRDECDTAQRNHALDNIKDAIREAYLNGLVGGAKLAQETPEVSDAGDQTRPEGGL